MSKYGKLLEVMEAKGYNRTRLAIKCGIAPTNFYMGINGDTNFFPKWRKLVAEILEVSEEELFPSYKLNEGA